MSTLISQTDFYQEFLMARGSFEPSEYGVDMTMEAFSDLMVDEFGEFVRDDLSLDELLLRPLSALEFTYRVRTKHGFYDLPDDIILRTVMRRRKNP